MNPATTPAPPRRLRADAVRNQQRILAAARHLFAERGLEVTLDDVAEAANVGIGTVYRRYANKHELINEVLTTGMTEVADAAEAAGANPDAWAGLIEFCDFACRHMADNRGLGEMMLSVPESVQQLGCVRDRVESTVNHLLEHAISAGVLRPGIVGTDFFALLTMVESMATLTRPVNPEAWRRYLAILLDGIRGDSVPRQPLPVDPLTEDEIHAAKHAVFAARKK
ncbi:TetR/AcrR family transcriptional regulator [Nocardia sp. alder85J]|uniref:TetR/AcrR family transcriptional regulator n=1 Tax=Nocardia sp. alder85J TaxID=2862949 RepID=UPI001CD366DD|nr:TetR/AcrR family transcriptional regulator [Nocardia sp. alder85J]MCX4097046.1 helix-turn-helix domain containing protein [Nocardia sp. alder85J]